MRFEYGDGAVPAATTIYHSRHGLVQRAKREAFEIFAFRMMQADGMVHRMPQAFDDDDLTAGVNGGTENDFLK